MAEGTVSFVLSRSSVPRYIRESLKIKAIHRQSKLRNCSSVFESSREPALRSKQDRSSFYIRIFVVDIPIIRGHEGFVDFISRVSSANRQPRLPTFCQHCADSPSCSAGFPLRVLPVLDPFSVMFPCSLPRRVHVHKVVGAVGCVTAHREQAKRGKEKRPEALVFPSCVTVAPSFQQRATVTRNPLYARIGMYPMRIPGPLYRTRLSQPIFHRDNSP